MKDPIVARGGLIPKRDNAATGQHEVCFVFAAMVAKPGGNYSLFQDSFNGQRSQEFDARGRFYAKLAAAYPDMQYSAVMTTRIHYATQTGMTSATEFTD